MNLLLPIYWYDAQGPICCHFTDHTSAAEGNKASHSLQANLKKATQVIQPKFSLIYTLLILLSKNSTIHTRISFFPRMPTLCVLNIKEQSAFQI